MAIVVFQSGAFKLTTKYVIPWKDGVLYYSRRVPEAMRKHHNGKAFIRKSLGTRDPTVAAKQAARLAAEHDALWRSLGSPEANRHDLTSQETREAAAALLDAMGFKPGEAHMGCEYTREESRELFDERMGRRVGPEYMQTRHNPALDADQKAFEMGEMLNPVQVETERLFYGRTSRILLTDALNEYLRLKGLATGSKPAKDACRAIRMVTDELGDLPLEALTRPNAIKVRDAFLANSGKTATVRRRLNTINAIINMAIKEHSLECRNHFGGLVIPREDEDAEEREPFTTSELKQIAAAAWAVDDDIRHIVLMQFDTGARAGEIIGLRIEDAVADADIPHLKIRPHKKLGRTLKNAQSERDVPLVGEALRAARKALVAAKADKAAGGWLFPRYASDGDVKATHGSNTINQWLRSLPGIDKTTHSFRHAMRDRLRAAQTPREIQDLIGGWGSRSVGQGYGEGYSLEVLRGYLAKVVLPLHAEIDH